MKRIAVITASALLLATSRPAAAQPAGSVPFPKPFVVEHRLIQTATDGSTFQTEPVTDYYGGSWLVSVHSDQSRLIVDFSRKEISEIRTSKGTYWTLTFQQMKDLRERLQRAEAPPEARAPRRQQAAKSAVRVEEVADGGREARVPLAQSANGRALRHLRASVDASGTGDATPSVDIWVDGTVSLTPQGLSALEAFESEALATVGGAAVSPADLLGAARRKANGAFPVRTRRALGATGSDKGSASEDVATRLTPLDTFPQKLLVVNDGFRRVPSPLEIQVSFAEEEAQRRSGPVAK